MNDREKLEGRLAELRLEYLDMQQSLAQVRQTEQTLNARIEQNMGAQGEVQRLLREQGEENAGDEDQPAEAENKPEAEEAEKPAAPG